MSDALATIGDDEAMLARLAALDLAAAERVHEKLMQAEEPADLAELGRTYQRLARSLRQTLILKAKVGQGRLAEQKAAERRAADERQRPYQDHQHRILTRVEPLFEEACEHLDDEDDYEAALEKLQDRASNVIYEAMLEPGFLETPADTHAQRLCARLGLKAPPPTPPGSPPGPAPAPPSEAQPPDDWSSA